MGTYVANGLVIGISVYCEKDEKKDKNDLEKIKKHLSKYFCLEYYDVSEKNDNSFDFTIKKEMLEADIHDCLRDFNRLIKNNFSFPLKDYKDKIDFKSVKFNQENYPIKLELVDKYDEKELEMSFMDEAIFHTGSSFGEPYWIYKDSDLFGYRYKYHVYFDIKTIWSDFNKISIENEHILLYCLNKMKNKFFKNKLAKNTIFYIEG